MGLGSFVSSIFGGGEEAEATTQSTMNAEQRKILEKLLLPYFESVSPVGDYREEAYPGKLSTGMSNLEQMSLAALEERAKGFAAGEKTPLRQEGESALTRTLQADPTEWENFYQTNIQEPLLKEFEEDIYPRIGRKYAPSGYWSGERARSEEDAVENLTDALTRGRFETGFAARESALERSLRGAQMVPEYDETEFNPLLRLLQAGGVPRGVEQGALDREYQDFLRRIGGRGDIVNQMIGAIGVPTTQTVVKPGSPGADLTGLAQLGTLGAKLGGFL